MNSEYSQPKENNGPMGKAARDALFREQERMDRRKFLRLGLKGMAIAGVATVGKRLLDGGEPVQTQVSRNPVVGEIPVVPAGAPEASGVETVTQHSSESMRPRLLQEGLTFGMHEYAKVAETARSFAEQIAPTLEEVLARPGLGDKDLSFDIPMNRVPEIRSIRVNDSIPHRFLDAVSYLGVQTIDDVRLDNLHGSTPRYRNSDGNRWTCNVYAQDLARLLLDWGPNASVIGHWTGTNDQMPYHLSAPDKASMTEAQWNAWSSDKRQMDSFDMMVWMQSEVANTLGWQRVETQSELFAALQHGHIAYCGSNPERNKHGYVREEYHNYVMGWSPATEAFPQGIPLLSQSTSCRILNSDLNSPKFWPEQRSSLGISDYIFFIHKAPTATERNQSQPVSG